MADKIVNQYITSVAVKDGALVVGGSTVKISAAQDNRWVVLEGLKAGEQVMVDGFQKLQMLPPGTAVKAGSIENEIELSKTAVNGATAIRLSDMRVNRSAVGGVISPY